MSKIKILNSWIHTRCPWCIRQWTVCSLTMPVIKMVFNLVSKILINGNKNHIWWNGKEIIMMRAMLLKGIAKFHHNRLNRKIRNNLSRIHLLAAPKGEVHSIMASVLRLMEEMSLVLLGTRRLSRRGGVRSETCCNYAKVSLLKSKILSSKNGLFKVFLHQNKQKMLNFNYFKHYNQG